MAKRKLNEDTEHDFDELFSHEMQVLRADLEQQAAMAMLHKLKPSNQTSVEDFFGELRQHKDLWTAICNMGIRDFADAVNDHRSNDAKPTRTRISDDQKERLKDLVIERLAAQKDGLSRHTLAEQVTHERAVALGINPTEMATKLRQPLVELLKEHKIYSQGQKRQMRYFAAQAAVAPSGRGRRAANPEG